MTGLDTYLASRPGRCAHGYAAEQAELHACTPTPAASPVPHGDAAGPADDDEWGFFVAKCRQVRRPDGTVHACDLRPLLRAGLAPKRISSLYRTARSRRLLIEVGTERSDDDRGRNAGRHEPFYRLQEAAA